VNFDGTLDRSGHQWENWSGMASIFLRLWLPQPRPLLVVESLRLRHPPSRSMGSDICGVLGQCIVHMLQRRNVLTYMYGDLLRLLTSMEAWTEEPYQAAQIDEQS
jgi:hypothetical protein